MAIIKVDKNYIIDIDGNKDHTVKFDTGKISTDKEGKESVVYRVVGHYGNVINSCMAVLHDMNISKANSEDSITIKEYVDIMKENMKYMEKLLEKDFNEKL